MVVGASAWTRRLRGGRLLFALGLGVFLTACGAETPGSGQTAGSSPSLPEGESHWRLTVQRGEEKGVTVQFFPSAASGGQAGKAPSGSGNVLTYHLFLEVKKGRLRRCAAKEANGKFATVTCALGNAALTIAVGEAPAGQIVMRLAPDQSAQDREWRGAATIHHPALPMDVKIGTAEMVPADHVGADGQARAVDNGR